jgi:myxalamid-type polyketide synthase MxaB
MNNTAPDHQKLLSEALAAIRTLRHRIDELESARSEPIAVVGIGCRFPPDIDSPEAFWSLLARGGDAVTEIPADRWDSDFYHDPDASAPGKICTRRGGFLRHKDLFDPQFFKISPREATYMDPQQRLLLEVAWEALEHANIPAEEIHGTDGGVFIGISGFDYGNLASEYLPEEEIDPSLGTGAGHSPAAGRISYVLGLQGPSICLDTACSSSLVSVHAACESLRRRECSMALAGGVSMILSPLNHIVFSRARMLSRDGRCKAFDESADGYVRSEGAGLLVLKRLSVALANQDTVLAVIRGGAVNQDGASGGLTVPNGPAQQEVIRRALENARLNAADVGYVEAHGTGTALGDPIEMNALSEVFKKSHTASRPLWVGSAKTNLGHMESAAGIGGLIKVILQLQKGMIAPHLHFERPSSRIPWTQLPVKIPTALMPWPTPEISGTRKRIAGVSSFGFSGTNAHLLLEAAPYSEPRSASQQRSRHLLTLSAKSEDALKALALCYRSTLEQHSTAEIAEACHSAAVGRSHHNHRAAIVAGSVSELNEKLKSLDGDELAESVFRNTLVDDQPARVAFLFTGQGSQYYGMGRELYQTQARFRETLEKCDEILLRETGWSLLDVLYSNANHSLVHQTAYSQPLLFSIEYALAQLWQSWGIQPAAVMGHSVGEYVAAAIAGAFSLEDGLKLVAARGRLMQALPAGGGMMAIQSTFERVSAMIAPFASSVSLAAINGPRSVVISGPLDDLRRVAAVCTAENLLIKELEVSHAFHSPLMNPMLAEFAAVAETVMYSTPHIDVVSNVTGDIARAELAGGEYWVRHISAPVRFSDGIQRLSKLGCKAMVEIGPKPTLIDMGRICVAENLQWLASLRPERSDWAQMLESVARMYVSGLEIDWEKVNAGYFSEKVTLPTYPFQRQRYWFAPHVEQKKISRRNEKLHPLLGRQLPVSRNQAGHSVAKQIVFESRLGNNSAYLADHRVLGKTVFPAAGYVEVALAAGRSILGSAPALKNFSVQRPLLMSADSATWLRTVIEPGASGDYSFKIMSRQEDGADETSGDWTLHSQGFCTADSKEHPVTQELDSLQQTIAAAQEIGDYYESVRRRGLDYGAAFRTIRELRFQDRESLGRIVIQEEIAAEAEEYILHPTLLDGAFQILGATLREASEGGTYLPIGFDALYLLKNATGPQWAHVALRTPAEEGSRVIMADVTLYDESGDATVTVSGLRLVHTTEAVLRQALEGDPAEYLYRLAWVRRPQLEEPENRIEQESFLIFADADGIAEQVAQSLRERGCRPFLVYAENGIANRGAGEDGACTVNPTRLEDFHSLFDVAGQSPYRAILYFWGLNLPPAGEDREISFDESRLLGCGPLLNLTKALAKRPAALSTSLFVFSRNASSVHAGSPVRVNGAALTGLVRVARLEYPSLRCTVVDLDGDRTEGVEERQIVSEVLAGDGEEHVALRSGLRFGLRLTRMKPARSSATSGPVQIVIDRYGAFENIGLEPLKRRSPERGEIEVAVRAAAINFKDVLLVLGMLKAHALKNNLQWTDRRTLGFECSGTIVAIGEGVSGKKPGDEVICFGSECMSSYVTLPSDAAVLKPKSATFEEAAAVSTAFLTAYHALYNLAKIGPGDKVLIHAGAGSVGQAAIQLCRRVGAEVFVTASLSKWNFLKSQGVRHIMNSRTTEFKDEIRELTAGRGVDVVLNSLSGDFIPSSLEVLAPGGRFVEIGKLDIWTAEQMAATRRDVSYFTFDLSEVAQDVSSSFNTVLTQVASWMDAGRVKALPIDAFSPVDTGAAFRHLAQGKNVGKVVISFPPLEAAAKNKLPINADSCYWVTGGLGALGLKVAEWLVEQGARRLVLSGRSGPSEEAKAALARLRERDVHVQVVAADVGNRADVVAVLKEIDRSGVPLRGIVHAAGVLDDGMLQDQDWGRFQRVMEPKIGGAWNLHGLTKDRPLDFFVCFSSISAVLGSPGQGNYAVANAWMDALMQYRNSIGLPGLSIDWGPWASVGMAARLDKEIQTRMAAKGVPLIPVHRALSVLGEAMRSDHAQVIAAIVDWQKFAKQFHAASVPTLLEGLVEGGAASGAAQATTLNGILDKLASAPATERHGMVLAEVRQALAAILRLPSASSIGVNQSLGELGLDSLMAVEVGNLLSEGFRCELPSTLIFDYPTANALATYLVQSIFPEQPSAETTEPSDSSAEIDLMLSELEAMPDSDASQRFLRGEHAAAGVSGAD